MCAPTTTARTTFMNELELHYNAIGADREELARVARFDEYELLSID